MKTKGVCLLFRLSFTLGVFAGILSGQASESPGSYQQYKKDILRDSSLIRFYSFEENYGYDVKNHVVLKPGRIALSGGPLGSLTANHLTGFSVIAYGTTFHDRNDRIVSPSWTRGRLPGKSALRSGSVQLGLFRSGITGKEFANGMCIAGWFRAEDKIGTADLLRISRGTERGLRLIWSFTDRKGGALEFRAAGKKSVVLKTSGLPANQWIHFALMTGNGKASLHIGGKRVAETDFPGSIRPGNIKDYPQQMPFKEWHFGNNTDVEPLLVAANPKKAGVGIRLDLDELAIWKRALPERELTELVRKGMPVETAEEQRRALSVLRKRETIFDRVNLKFSDRTGGYFRINEPVEVLFDIPAELSEAARVVVKKETLDGKSLGEEMISVRPGERGVYGIRFPACGIYFVDMDLLDAKGKRIFRIPKPYCIAVISRYPGRLAGDNPVAYWADFNSKFHFDSPTRRMNYFGDGSFFEKIYQSYSERIPSFRAYVFFNLESAVVVPKEGEVAGGEKNRAFFRKAVGHLKGKNILGFEMTSEPNILNPEWYVRHLADAKKIFEDAGISRPMIPPGGAPPSIPKIAAVLKAGGDRYMDGISYHPYSTMPIRELNNGGSREKLQTVLDCYPKKHFTLWNTESGVCSLPRIKNRPMRAADGYAAEMPSRDGQFLGTITMLEEEDAAAVQVQHILINLLQGYSIYTICQVPNIDGEPCLRGVALTALSGQVLNRYKSIRRVSLSSSSKLCLVIDSTDGSRTAALFSEKPERVTLRLAPNKKYRMMDMLGNDSIVSADDGGKLSLNINSRPKFLFEVPETIREETPLSLELPSDFPDNGIICGTVRVENRNKEFLKGTLSAVPVEGAEIRLSENTFSLAPGGKKEFRIEVCGKTLKNRSYSFEIRMLDEKGNSIAVSERLIQSPGVIRMIPRVEHAMSLDGNTEKWKNVPAMVCRGVDSVVHGKPNYAEIWVPQWMGEKDLSFSVRTVWRKNDGIYFLVQTTDDVLIPAPADKSRFAFQFDCLELFIDTRPEKEQGKLLSQGMDQMLVIPAAGVKSTPCRFVSGRQKNPLVKLECVGRRTSNGWLMEGRLVPAANSSFRVLPGSRLRMDFLVDDTDREEPGWQRKSAMAVDGNFQNAMNSNLWGRYELSPDLLK